MTKIKNPDKLQKGDIILYAGSDWISDIINYFDDSDYSHASIYIGNDKIMESSLSGGGCKINDLKTSAEKYDKVLLKRHKDAENLNMDLVIEKALKFKDSRYDVTQILQLALVGINRKLSRYDRYVAKVLVKILEIACDVSLKMFANRDKTTVCSEFVYRCYHDVKKGHGDEYEIQVGKAGIHMLDGIKRFNTRNRFAEPGSLVARNNRDISFTPDIDLVDRLKDFEMPELEKNKIHEFEKHSEMNLDFFDDVATPLPTTDFQLSEKDQKELEELFKEMKATENSKRIVEVDETTENLVLENMDKFMCLNSPQNQGAHRIVENFSSSGKKNLFRNSYVFHRQHFVTTKDLRRARNLVDVNL